MKLKYRKNSTKTGKNFRGGGERIFLSGQNIYPCLKVILPLLEGLVYIATDLQGPVIVLVNANQLVCLTCPDTSLSCYSSCIRYPLKKYPSTLRVLGTHFRRYLFKVSEYSSCIRYLDLKYTQIVILMLFSYLNTYFKYYTTLSASLNKTLRYLH